MLASQVLRAEQRPAKAASARATRPEHRGRAALKAWRIVLDKLYCVLQWDRYQTAISAWMCFPATNLEVSPASTTTTRSGATLAATSKANFYKNYLEKNREQLARVKGLPTKSSEECLHEAQYLKGRGNGHMNWVHCSQCLSRWKLSPRSASIVTGRALIKTSASSTPASAKAKAKQAPVPAPATSSSTDTGKEEKYQAVIAGQKKDLDQLRAQLELLQGPGPEMDLAEDACLSLEMVLDSMDEGLRQDAQQMVREFKRLQRVERESRYMNTHRPSKETRIQWTQASESLKVGASQILAYYQAVLQQRSQIATLLLRS